MMKKIKYTGTLLAAFLLAVVLTSCAQENDYKDVNVERFEKLIQSQEGTVLDVRTPEEVAEGHLENAVHYNIYDEDFKEKVMAGIDKKKPVYVYCKSGGRSSKAAGILIENGYEEVYNLDGGITAWTAAGKKVVQDEK